MEYPLILIDNVDTPRPSKRINIGIELRNAILKQLLEAANEGVNLPRGTIATISKTFKVHRETVKTIWRRHISGDAIGNKRGRSGRAKSIKLRKRIEDELPTINIEKGIPHDH